MTATDNQQEKKAPLIILLTLIAYLITYILRSYLANKLGSNFYGEYAIAWQVLVLIGFIALLGTNTAGTRYLANFLHLHKDVDALSYIKWNIKFIRGTFITCWAIGVLSFITMLFLHIFHVHDIREHHLIFYMFWIAPAYASIFLLTNYLLANNNFILSTFLQGTLLNLIFLVCFFCAFHIWPNHFTKFEVSLVLFVSTVTVAFICFIVVVNKIKLVKQLNIRDLLLGKNANQPLWRNTSYKLAITQLSFFVMTACVLFILQVVLHSNRKVGYFSAGITISTILFVVGFAITVPLRPLISSLCASKSGKNALQAKVNFANLLFVIFLVPLMIMLIIFSRQLLNHFGADFVQAQPTCIILILSEFVFSFTLIGQAILSYSGYAKVVMVTKLITVALALIGGIFATIFFGLKGMAYTTLVFSSVNLLLISYFCQQKLSIRCLSIY